MDGISAVTAERQDDGNVSLVGKLSVLTNERPWNNHNTSEELLDIHREPIHLTLLMRRPICLLRLDSCRHIDAASPPDHVPNSTIFLFQARKPLLGFPVPDAVTLEDDVDLFEGSLVCFWVECPDDHEGKDVDAAEDVECFLVKAGEDGWE